MPKRYLLYLIESSIFGPLLVARRVLSKKVYPSFLCLSFSLCGHFLGFVSIVFSNLLHGAINPYKVVSDRAGSFQKKKKERKRLKMDQKRGFFQFIEKFGH